MKEQYLLFWSGRNQKINMFSTSIDSEEADQGRTFEYLLLVNINTSTHAAVRRHSLRLFTGIGIMLKHEECGGE